MKIEKFKKLKDNRYELTFDKNIKLVFYDDIIVKYNLISKKDIDKKMLDKIVKENDKLTAYYLSLKYINIKLRSESEIISYLKCKDFGEEDINNTIKKLKDNNFIDNKLYLSSYINDQVNLTNNGYYKILRDLERLGFTEAEILVYLNKIDSNIWQEKLDKLITKKLKLNQKYSGKKLIEKITYDLVNLGYPKEMILNALENYHYSDSGLLEKEYIKLMNKLANKYEGKELMMHVKKKLAQKGFSYDDINELIKKNNL